MLLDGKKLRNEKIEELKEQVNALEQKPTLAVIQIGNNPASDVYVRQKGLLAQKLGFHFEHKKYEEHISKQLLEEEIKKLNDREDVNGIMIQLPLPNHFDEEYFINLIDPNKDVDGLTDINAGRLWKGKEAFIPCTPKGILTLLKKYQIPLESKKVVMVGRSILVGKPMAALLLKENATVTICHSKTKNLKNELLQADIVIVAIGKPKFITGDMIKEDSVVVDVGINRLETGLVGDVDFETVSKKTSYITPVPGGVGPMTVYSLMENTYLAYQRQQVEIKKLIK